MGIIPWRWRNSSGSVDVRNFWIVACYGANWIFAMIRGRRWWRSTKGIAGNWNRRYFHSQEIIGNFTSPAGSPDAIRVLFNITNDLLSSKISWMSRCRKPFFCFVCEKKNLWRKKSKKNRTDLPPMWLSTKAFAPILLAKAPAISGTECPFESALSRTAAGVRLESLPDGSACCEICESVASWISSDGDGLQHNGSIAEGS